MTSRYTRLLEPEPYRAAGTNTLRAAVVIQTLRAKRKPAVLPKRRLKSSV